MEWLPNATFVLDMYHKNKYIRQMLAGYDAGKALRLRKDIDQALDDEDEVYFDNIVRLLVDNSPERTKKIQNAAACLRKHMADISIRTTDPAACNGGATEPHVSHVLSDRLSSRPKGWSEKTLQFFAPVLANGPDIILEGGASIAVNAPAMKAVQKACRKARGTGTSAPPKAPASLLITRKKSPLSQALYDLSHSRLR